MTDLKTAHLCAQETPALQTDRKADEPFVAYMTRVARMGDPARQEVISKLETEISTKHPPFVIKSPLEKDPPPQTPERMDAPPWELASDPDRLYLLKAGRAFLKSSAQDMSDWLNKAGHVWIVNETQHNMVITQHSFRVIPHLPQPYAQPARPLKI